MLVHIKWWAAGQSALSTFLKHFLVLFIYPLTHLAVHSCAILQVAGETAFISCCYVPGAVSLEIFSYILWYKAREQSYVCWFDFLFSLCIFQFKKKKFLFHILAPDRSFTWPLSCLPAKCAMLLCYRRYNKRNDKWSNMVKFHHLLIPRIPVNLFLWWVRDGQLNIFMQHFLYNMAYLVGWGHSWS